MLWSPSLDCLTLCLFRLDLCSFVCHCNKRWPHLSRLVGPQASTAGSTSTTRHWAFQWYRWWTIVQPVQGRKGGNSFPEPQKSRGRRRIWPEAIRLQIGKTNQLLQHQSQTLLPSQTGGCSKGRSSCHCPCARWRSHLRFYGPMPGDGGPGGPPLICTCMVN